MTTSARWPNESSNKGNNMHIGIIGSKNYENIRKIKDLLFSLKQKFGDQLIISSGGTRMGAEKHIKKYALEFNIRYQEYNPAHTPHGLYSAISESYYDQPYHGSQHHHRYMLLGRSVEKLIVLVPANENTDLYKMAIDTVKKRKKSFVVMS